PTINGTATQNYNLGRNIDPFTNIYINQQVRSNNFSLNGSLVLFNGFVLQNSLKQSKNEALAAQQDIDQYRLDLSINIVQAYLSILLNEEQVVNTERQAATTKAVYDRTERLKQSGVLTASSSLDVFAQWKQEEATFIQAQNDLQLAYLNLGILLQLSDPMSVRIAKPSEAIQSDSLRFSSPEQVMTDVSDQIPQLKALEYRKQSAAYTYYSSKGRYYPKLTLNGSLSTLYSTSGKIVERQDSTGPRPIGYTQSGETVYTTNYTTITSDKNFGLQIGDNLNKFIGLTLTVPILNGLQVRTTVHRSKIALENADLDLTIARFSLKRTIYTAFYQARGSQHKFRALNQSYAATQESYRNAEKRFENGVINSVELSQVKTRLNQSQSDLLLSKYDFIFKNAILDIYAGQILQIE
ncbi:MAG: TolC family protein, partial [Cytophagales bacterium]|nr:TolC family protein [Cytophaga sp.]